MAKPSAMDSERMEHINHIMGQLYSLLPEIYEAMVDEEYTILKKKSNEMIKTLKYIIESTEDEV